MATLYMDPVGGNNANDGLSFANRKRTFNSVTTAANPGDTIRVIASPDPFSVGSATWTDNTKTIAWTNSSNLLVDGCDSGWTGVTNATVSHPTDNIERTGTSYLNVLVASAFTTGKAAYKTLAAPLTVSAFQQIGLFFQTSSTSATINFKVCLCSDTTGTTIVAEVSKTLVFGTDYMNANDWVRLTLDYGSAFPATSINSVAIYLNADTGVAVNFRFDGIVLCKAPGASDLIDYNSLIGKNTGGEPEWYPIGELSEAGVSIAGNLKTSLAACKPYRGTTESVTTYIRNPLILKSPWADTDAAVKDFNLIIEGGYNRTDMSTKTGETWISGDFLWTGYNGDTLNRNDVSLLNIGFVHCPIGMKNVVVGDDDGDHQILGLIACETPITYLMTGTSSGWGLRNSGYVKFTCKQVWCPQITFTLPNRPGEYTVGRIHGQWLDDGISSAAFTPGTSYQFNPATYTIGKVDNNRYGISLETANSGLKLSGTVLQNNQTDFRVSALSAAEHTVTFDNMADVVIDVDGYRQALPHAIDSYPSIIRQTRIAGDPDKHRTTHGGLLCFQTNQTIRHTASGYSWRLFAPMEEPIMWTRPAGTPPFPLASFAVAADKLVTVTCWVYVEFNVVDTWWGPGTFPHAIWGIMIQPDAAMGLSRIQVEADSETVATWQQVTLTFTPSEAGVVTVYAYAYGTPDQEYLEPPAQFSAYYDDLAVTQEP